MWVFLLTPGNNEFFTPLSDGISKRGFFLPTYMPLSNFSNSRSKRFVFIHIIFFLLSHAKSEPKLSFVSGGRSKKELVFISQNLGAVFILTGHKQ